MRIMPLAKACSAIGVWLWLVASLAAQSQEASDPATDDGLHHSLASHTFAAFDSGTFDGMAERFASTFLKRVPIDNLNSVPSGYQTRYGKVLGVDFVSKRDDAQGFGRDTLFFNVRIEGERRALLRIRLDAQRQITAWHISPASEDVTSMTRIRRKLHEVEGRVSVFARQPGQNEPLFALFPDDVLAIGSTAQLYVVAELLRQSEAIPRPLDNVVTLRRAAMSSGGAQSLANWAPGAPLTLQSLATLMISKDDPTAMDHLIDIVGREEIERHLGRLYANSLPDRNVPFLKRREVYLLQADGEPYARHRARFLSRGIDGKRSVLRELQQTSADGIPSDVSSAGASGRIQWFASTRDIAELMEVLHGDDLLDQAETRHTARGILSIEPGVPNSEGDPRIAYLGFKGASEAGILTLTQFVETKAGQQFTLAMTWNGQQPTPEAALRDAFLNLRRAILNRLDNPAG